MSEINLVAKPFLFFVAILVIALLVLTPHPKEIPLKTFTKNSTPFVQPLVMTLLTSNVSNSVIDAGLSNQFGCCAGQYSNISAYFQGGIPPYYVKWYYYPPYQSNILPGNMVPLQLDSNEVALIVNASSNYNLLSISENGVLTKIDANEKINVGRSLDVNSTAGQWNFTAEISDSASNYVVVSNSVTIYKNPTVLETPSNVYCRCS